MLIFAVESPNSASDQIGSRPMCTSPVDFYDQLFSRLSHGPNLVLKGSDQEMHRVVHREAVMTAGQAFVLEEVRHDVHFSKSQAAVDGGLEGPGVLRVEGLELADLRPVGHLE